MEVEKTSVVDVVQSRGVLNLHFFFGAGEVLNGTSIVKEQECFI